MKNNILAVNSGSSSLKSALYSFNESSKLGFSCEISGIGSAGARMRLLGTDGTFVDSQVAASNGDQALSLLFETIENELPDVQIDAIGHRLVHGGDRYHSPTLVTGPLLNDLAQLIPFDPLHLPIELKAIASTMNHFRDKPQVVCFDTAFHRTIPSYASIFALPQAVLGKHLHKYGFHGLSYEYLLQSLEEASQGRTILAHLGSGASMAAVSDGRCIDTTMGFSSTGGLVMASRSGDLDPGLLVYLIEQMQIDATALRWMLNHESGLKGISGISGEMKELIAKEKESPAAALAIAIFCYQAKKHIGALAAALGGLDMLVFTGGIGENAPLVRRLICKGLAHLGVNIDEKLNDTNAGSINNGIATVYVAPTNEELIIARHTRRLLFQSV